METSNVLGGRFPALIPGWLAWPMSALSTIAAFVGAGLVLAAAAFGSIRAAAWGGIAFLVAAVAWHVADFARANRPAD